MGIKVHELVPRMASEDFGWYLTKAPGLLFRYGIYDAAFGSGKAAHTGDFKIYEPAMKSAMEIFLKHISFWSEREKNDRA